MFDIIGFWTGVTVVSTAMLGVFVSIGFVALCSVVVWASRERVYLWEMAEDKVRKKLNNRDFELGGFLFCWFLASVCMWFLCCIAVEDVESVKTIPEIVSYVALHITPLMSVIGTMVVIMGGGALILRKSFDFFFKVKERLDKAGF